MMYPILHYQHRSKPVDMGQGPQSIDQVGYFVGRTAGVHSGAAAKSFSLHQCPGAVIATAADRVNNTLQLESGHTVPLSDALGPVTKFRTLTPSLCQPHTPALAVLSSEQLPTSKEHNHGLAPQSVVQGYVASLRTMWVASGTLVSPDAVALHAAQQDVDVLVDLMVRHTPSSDRYFVALRVSC